MDPGVRQAGPRRLLIRTNSLYVGVYDQNSPVNVPGFLTDTLAAAGEDIRARGLDSTLKLFAFNDRLCGHAKKGHLLSWTVLFDGVFALQLEIEPESSEVPPSRAPSDSLNEEPLCGNLELPTGRVIIGCLSRLGEKQQPVIEVAPGLYYARLMRDSAEESRHHDIDDCSDYPDADGPDWRLVLRKRPRDSS